MTIASQKLTYRDISHMVDVSGIALDYQYDFFINGFSAAYPDYLPAQSADLSLGNIAAASTGFGNTAVPLNDTINISTIDSADRQLLQAYRTWAEKSAGGGIKKEGEVNSGFRRCHPIGSSSCTKELEVVWYATKYDGEANTNGAVGIRDIANRAIKSGINSAINPLLDSANLRVAEFLSDAESKLFSDKTNVSFRDLVQVPNIRARAFNSAMKNSAFTVVRTTRRFLVTPTGSVQETFAANGKSASLLQMQFQVVGGGEILQKVDVGSSAGVSSRLDNALGAVSNIIQL